MARGWLGRKFLGWPDLPYPLILIDQLDQTDDIHLTAKVAAK